MIVMKHEIGKVRAISTEQGFMFCLYDLVILLDYAKAYSKVKFFQRKYDTVGVDGILFISEMDASDIIDHRWNVIDTKTINALRALVKRRKYGWIAEEMK